MKMRRHYLKYLVVTIIVIGASYLYGATGTPSTLVVRTDANGSLVVTGATQVSPITQGVFASRVLRTDANGNLQVIIGGGPISPSSVSLPASTCAAPALNEQGATTTGIAFTANPSIGFCLGGLTGPSAFQNSFRLNNAQTLSWVNTGNTETGTIDISLSRSAAKLLNSDSSMQITRGTITTDLPVRTDTVTWNSGGITFTGWKLVVTDTASAAGSLLMDLQVGAGTSKFSVDKSGAIVSASSITSASRFLVASRFQLQGAGADGLAQFINVAGSNWTRVIFGTNDTTTAGFSFEKDSGGHYNFARGDGSNGTLAVANIGANSCGTSAATIAGNDHVMVITVGATGGTACRVTFVSTWATAPVCVANNLTTAANLANANASTTTTIDVTGTFVAGDKLGVICGTY